MKPKCLIKSHFGEPLQMHFVPKTRKTTQQLPSLYIVDLHGHHCKRFAPILSTMLLLGIIYNPKDKSHLQHTRLDTMRATKDGQPGRTQRCQVASRACGQPSHFVNVVLGEVSCPLCPWRVRCQLQRIEKFTITVCDLKHTYRGLPTIKWRGLTHNSAWLGEMLANKVSYSS